MKNKKVLLLALSMTTVSAFGVCSFVLGSQKDASSTIAVEKSLTLDENKLKSIAFDETPYDLSSTYPGGSDWNPNDNRSFSYEIGGGKYFEGALLFADCKHQSVGSTLGDPLVLNNGDQEGANASNFNILFNIKGVYKLAYTYDVTLSKAATVDITLKTSVKSSSGCPNGIDGIKNYGYESLVGPMGLFYTIGGSTDSVIAAGTTLSGFVHEFDFSTSVDKNVVSLQSNAYSVPEGIDYSITLKSLTFYYSC